MEQKKNIALPLVMLAAGIIVGFLGGYLVFSAKPGAQKKSADLENLVNVTFPKPSEDLRSVNAKILKIDGNKIQVEVPDPEDYLPHTDGSPQATMTRVAVVGEATEMFLLRPTQIDRNGNIGKTEISLSDLKAGDTVAITSSENIRTENEFDVMLIEKVEY